MSLTKVGATFARSRIDTFLTATQNAELAASRSHSLDHLDHNGPKTPVAWNQ